MTLSLMIFRKNMLVDSRKSNDNNMRGPAYKDSSEKVEEIC